MSVMPAKKATKTKQKATSTDPDSVLELFRSLNPAASPISAELERERLVSLINSMADGVIAVDGKGKIVLYNGAALNILDVNTSLASKYLDNVCKITDQDNQPIGMTELILKTKTQTTSRDYRLRYPDGSTSNLYLSIAPVKLGFGKEGNKGFVILLRDITREKSLEEERDEFISVVSHELRTPIAIAEGNIGNAEFIVQKTGGNYEVAKALQQAHDQIMFLSGMINDLSTLSRAERGRLAVDIESINAYRLVEELAEEYRPHAKEKGLKIRTQLTSDLELLHSSKLYVREILQNLITNAIKYTEKGTVTIGAESKGRGVLFEVTDTGIGISKGDQERIFDKFFRSEDYRTREHNGTGLGLYVTAKLARMIHAEIKLHSVLNKGTTFSIFIPNLQ